MGKPVVLHLISSGFYGGPEKLIVNHLSHIDKRRFEPHLAAFVESFAESVQILDEAEERGIPCTAVQRAGWWDPQSILGLTRVIKSVKPSLLCTHGYKAAVLGVFAAKILGTPVIAVSHGYTTENAKVAFYEWVERKSLAWTDGVISVSAAQQNRLDNFGVRYRKGWVVLNAAEAVPDEELDSPEYDQVLTELGLPESARFVVCAGRLSLEKNHSLLINAVSTLSEEFPDVYIVICGDGPLRSTLEEQVRNAGLAEKCLFVGFQKDLNPLYARMEFLVLPSLTEGLPLVVLEAMSFAKPVVASAVGGVPELVVHGENGLLVPAGDLESLSAAIAEALRSADEMRSYGARARRLVTKGFSYAEHARKMESIYSEVLAPRGHSGTL